MLAVLATHESHVLLCARVCMHVYNTTVHTCICVYGLRQHNGCIHVAVHKTMVVLTQLVAQLGGAGDQLLAV